VRFNEAELDWLLSAFAVLVYDLTDDKLIEYPYRDPRGLRALLQFPGIHRRDVAAQPR
jgi:hypothetical protein